MKNRRSAISLGSCEVVGTLKTSPSSPLKYNACDCKDFLNGRRTRRFSREISAQYLIPSHAVTWRARRSSPAGSFTLASPMSKDRAIEPAFFIDFSLAASFRVVEQITYESISWIRTVNSNLLVM